MSKHTPGPWEIDWYICRVDASDLKDPESPMVRRNLKVGDELWRVPKSIGPLWIDHCHWAGYHINCEPADAHLASAATDLREALLMCIAHIDPTESKAKEEAYIKACRAIAKASGVIQREEVVTHD